jgi:uncharacterized protein YecT (DUF1311 family)
MRIVWAALALFVAACSSIAPYSAYADEREDFSPALIQCVARANGEEAMRACRGEMVRLCRAGDDSTMALTLCLSDEASAWEQRLDVASAMLTRAEPWRTEELAAAQAAWDAWLDVECSYRADAEQGGSGQQVDLAQCYLDHTAARAIEYTLRARALP